MNEKRKKIIIDKNYYCSFVIAIRIVLWWQNWMLWGQKCPWNSPKTILFYSRSDVKWLIRPDKAVKLIDYYHINMLRPISHWRGWKQLETAPMFVRGVPRTMLNFRVFSKHPRACITRLNNKSVLSITKRQWSTTSENLLLFLPALCDSKTHTDRRLKRFSLSNCSATNNLVDKFFSARVWFV